MKTALTLTGWLSSMIIMALIAALWASDHIERTIELQNRMETLQ